MGRERTTLPQKGAKLKLVNAFSANMLPEGLPVTVTFAPLTVGAVRAIETLDSAVGHADTAALFEATLGRPVAVARVTLALGVGDRLILGQYRGPRLPEGASTLPEGARIDWYLVTLE